MTRMTGRVQSRRAVRDRSRAVEALLLRAARASRSSARSTRPTRCRRSCSASTPPLGHDRGRTSSATGSCSSSCTSPRRARPSRTEPRGDERARPHPPLAVGRGSRRHAGARPGVRRRGARATSNIGAGVFVRDPDGQLVELLPMEYRRRLDASGSASESSDSISSSLSGFALRNARWRSGVRASRISPSASSTSSSSLAPNCAGTGVPRGRSGLRLPRRGSGARRLGAMTSGSRPRSTTSTGSTTSATIDFGDGRFGCTPALRRRRPAGSKPGSAASSGSVRRCSSCAGRVPAHAGRPSSPASRRLGWSRPASTRRECARRAAPSRAGARARRRAAGRGRPACATRSRRARRATPGAASTGSAASRPRPRRSPGARRGAGTASRCAATTSDPSSWPGARSRRAHARSHLSPSHSPRRRSARCALSSLVTTAAGRRSPDFVSTIPGQTVPELRKARARSGLCASSRPRSSSSRSTRTRSPRAAAPDRARRAERPDATRSGRRAWRSAGCGACARRLDVPARFDAAPAAHDRAGGPRAANRAAA